jgi:hypothetical protein
MSTLFVGDPKTLGRRRASGGRVPRRRTGRIQRMLLPCLPKRRRAVRRDAWQKVRMMRRVLVLKVGGTGAVGKGGGRVAWGRSMGRGRGRVWIRRYFEGGLGSKKKKGMGGMVLFLLLGRFWSS